MKIYFRYLSALLIWIFIPPALIAGSDAGRVINLMGSNCEHGPVMQPNGHFLAYMFCDSALGTNMGIVLSRLTNETETKGLWRVDQRFWQNGPWVTDITSIAWDPFSDRLFVATAEVYGDGGVFVLDLINRKHERVYSIEEVDSQTVQDKATELRAESHFGFIETLNVEEKSITVSIRLAYGDGQSKIVGKKTIRLGSAP